MRIPAAPAGLALVILALAPVAAGPQNPPQATFRAATSLVEVDVVVQDRSGRFVPGLTIDDLVVFEDGRPQQIQQFYLVTVAGGSVVPAATPAATPEPGARSQRLFVFLFDQAHLSHESLLRAKVGVERFINTQFQRGDIGGIFHDGAMHRDRLTTDKIELLSGLRGVTPAFDDRDKLLLAFRDFPQIPTENDAVRIEYGDQRLLRELTQKACEAMPEECSIIGGQGRVENRLQNKARDYVREARRATGQTLDNLRLVALNLATIPGRKTVVFLSDGFFIDESRSEVQEIAAYAARAGTAFYSVYGRGSSIIGGRALPDVLSPQPGLVSTFDSIDDGPEILSATTGGVVIRNLNDVSRAIGMVARDTSTYYVLGYRPTNSIMDGTVRKIEVQARSEGLRIRARKSYLASPLPPQQALRIGGGGQ